MKCQRVKRHKDCTQSLQLLSLSLKGSRRYWMAHIHNSNINRMPRLPSIQPRHRSCSIFDKTMPGSYKKKLQTEKQDLKLGQLLVTDTLQFLPDQATGNLDENIEHPIPQESIGKCNGWISCGPLNKTIGSESASCGKQIPVELVAPQWLLGLPDHHTACDHCSKGGVMSPFVGAATWQSAAPCISARTGAQFLKEK